MTIKAFFKTPKGLLLIILVIITVMAAYVAGVTVVMPGLIAATGVAMLIDAPILRVREKEWQFPSGAVLTGLIVAAILSPYQPWYVPATTSAVAVVSKYIVRVQKANVFNPAALALIATYYLFQSEQSWWGALPDLPLVAIVVLIGTGLYITNRLHKLPGVLAFLGAYYLMFSVESFVRDPVLVAEVYRAPDLHAALYFAFFMVTDPPTSPVKVRDQMIYGVIVAAVSWAAYTFIGAAYFLLAGLLAANIWEAWRRLRLNAQRAARRAAVA
jgi:Na+-translocating ferredoxin:NAD+ oxidoreductase RnfD subunit